jgi:hypothetical protein
MGLNFATWLEQIVVAVLVCAALAFSIWKLMPARGRLRVLYALDRWSARRPRLARWRERSLRPRIARAAGVGCDGCAANHEPPRQRPR